MIQIHEGVDRTGKTTLAKQHAAETGAEYRHFGVPEGDPGDEYLVAIASVGPRGAVFDRFHLGEAVWPTVFGRPSTYSLYDFRVVDNALVEHGALIVYHERARSEVVAALEAEGEPLTPDRLDEALELYERALKLTRIPVVRGQLQVLR